MKVIGMYLIILLSSVGEKAALTTLFIYKQYAASADTPEDKTTDLIYVWVKSDDTCV